MVNKNDLNSSKKDQIIDAAVILFASHGFYKTTTANVAKLVGVTQPYIFHFFKTKEELYLAVLDRAVGKIVDSFRTVNAPADKLVETMGRAFEGLISTYRDEMLLTMQSFTTPEPAIRDFARDSYSIIYQTVKKRFEEAKLPQSAYTASMFIASGLIITLSEVLGLPELSPFSKDC
ncbi:MAG: TetR family transcriptional regulator [Bacilli bacterium]|nr:TetR family transcriptional regulator [Bacilli bacterium]